METIRITDAKGRLSELLARVVAGERFLIRRRERPVAMLIGADELDRLERNARLAQRLAAALGPDAQLLAAIGQGTVHPAMAAFGLWRDDPATIDLVGHLAAERASQPARPAPEL